MYSVYLCIISPVISLQVKGDQEGSSSSSPMACELEIDHECPEDYQDHQASATSLVSCTLEDQVQTFGENLELRAVQNRIVQNCVVQDNFFFGTHSRIYSYLTKDFKIPVPS